MTTDQPNNATTEADVRAFAEKLETWAQGLTPKEQALLESILVSAAGDDTAGYKKLEGTGGSAFQKFRGVDAAAGLGVGPDVRFAGPVLQAFGLDLRTR